MLSTSDAGELRLIAAPPAHRTPRTPRSVPTRAQQDETFVTRFQPENNNGDGTPTGLECYQPAIRQEGAYRAVRFEGGSGRRQEAGYCAGSEKPCGSRFTSSVILTLPKNKLQLKLQLKPDSCPHSLTEPQKNETQTSCCQQTSPSDGPAEVASDCQLPQTIPYLATREEDIITTSCSELGNASHFSRNHNFSNDDPVPHENNGSHIIPCQGQQKKICSGTIEHKEDIKDHTKLQNPNSFEQSSRAVTMLPSSMVTVLAPHWSGRLRRTKRFEGSGNSELQGNLHGVGGTASNSTHGETQNQHCVGRVLTGGSEAQQKVSFLGTRSNSVDWSTKSDPAMGYESRRKVTQTVSLDVKSGRMDNSINTTALSPVTSPLSPLYLNPNEQRGNPQTSQQGLHSAISSKPTTSSLLLSLRRMNSTSCSSDAASTYSDKDPAPRDQEGNLLTHLSQTFLNNNKTERPKPILSPTFSSYRTTETGHVLSPSSSNHKERNLSKTGFFSDSRLNKDISDTPLIQQPEKATEHVFLSKGTTTRQEDSRTANKNTNILVERSVSSLRHSPYDPSAILKTHPVSRRTTLTSTSWWKQVTEEGSSLQPPSKNPNIKDQPNTSLVPPCNGNSDSAVPGPTDNKRLSSQIPNYNDNNNKTEPVCKGNMSLFKETQGGTPSLKQRNAGDSSDQKSDMLFSQYYGLKKDILKPPNLTNVLSKSKISRATEQTTLTHTKDLSEGALSTANVTPAFQNLRRSDTPTVSSSKCSNDPSSLKMNSTPTSPHNHSLSLSNALPIGSHSPTSKNTPGLPKSPNCKTSSHFLSQPVSSRNNIYTSSNAGASFQTPQFNIVNTTPLGFERSYPSVPKPKTVSSLLPTTSALSKTNYSPESTTSITPFTNGSHPVATTANSSFLLTPPATPATTATPAAVTLISILTPPATPVTTSPSYLETPSPKEERTLSRSPEREQKKKAKRVRRVTWEDSVDPQGSEPTTTEKPDQSGVVTGPLSPSRSPRSVRAPYIFSFLRSSSPATNASPLCPPTPKTSCIQVGTVGKYRSLSSDSTDMKSSVPERSKQGPDDSKMPVHVSQDLTKTRQERTLSVDSGTDQRHFSTPLSIPPDFSSGYKFRYGSPPYSTLISGRSAQGEPKPMPVRSPLFQQPTQSTYTPQQSSQSDHSLTIHSSKPPLLLMDPPQTMSSPSQNKMSLHESSKLSETDSLNSHSKNNNQDYKDAQILLVNNRVDISSDEKSDQTQVFSSTCVTETLVYSIKPKITAARTSPVNTKECKEVSSEGQAEQSSSGGSSAESQSQGDESCRSAMKESVLGKSKFFSVESNNEQSPKKSRFALNSILSRSDSERTTKMNNKMDQVLNKLRQTFSTRRSDDDNSFPWKWKRASQTPSVSGSSDISSFSDVTANGKKTLEEQEHKALLVLEDSVKVTEDTNRWTQNRYTIVPTSAVGITRGGDQFSVWSEKSTSDEQSTCAGHTAESKTQEHLTAHSPTIHQFDLYKDNRADYKPTIQIPTCRDPSPSRSPNPSGGYPALFRKSTSSPRSPFSPFSSLTPVSTFSSPDVTDDSVFYSPKLQRRRDSPTQCEPGEGISLGGPRRSRASTGPPSTGVAHDTECFASSYADLKYGIEPGRSYSVSSVLSSRPSGPGRISTGSRFMSVGDLSKSSVTCGGHGKDLDLWSFTSDWPTKDDCQPPGRFGVSHFPSDGGKIRSRSLPRSLTRRLANWSSGVSVSQPETNIAPRPAHLRNPNVNICHFEWDIDGPPTPPPTPPLSPVSRRISTPPSISPPAFPSLTGAALSVDNQSSRGHLPSRGYVSSLSTFEESSDSSSDTTTDDEYYIGEEKETEL